ncbi:GNAT family N-acetyltransferase [Inediibacterium massiliense]|uniref:GNAT family N-acetyltransferase n=1 Tax=Inediibacterium massiliense TaxID=1658111 RepID=UPI0006B57B34|nr:GNAT family N-acetyltransferase [Inediibacterium massiliense]
MNIKLRIAKESDIEWINETYRKIGFKESEFSNEKIVVAESNIGIAGLGRLQEIDFESSELGGIYVLEDYRGKGIATKIVSELVSISNEYKYVYCIPFEHLEHFYKSFGFEDINDRESVPEKIVKKHRWCNEYYEEKTLLLVKMNKSFT